MPVARLASDLGKCPERLHIMRGEDLQQHELFSYGWLEEWVPSEHPLRPIRKMVDAALKDMSPRFGVIYGEDGRKSIPPGASVAGAAAGGRCLRRVLFTHSRAGAGEEA